MLLDQILPVSSRRSSRKAKSSAGEKPLRSLVKTISWRVIGTLDTILISWLITGTWVFALSIGAVELITKMVLYYFHERAWSTIKWGK
ncbi:DUF2061 domain-containing protein [Croceiramulus getboli]|nr:DUF2061 domain-containing protein [Flavobacteriaceae bacterium YJPT1-3]